MPRISEFYGIVIEMYYSDHPPPHFHARYSGDEATTSSRVASYWLAHYPSGRCDSCENGWISTKPNSKQTGSVHATMSNQSPSSL